MKDNTKKKGVVYTPDYIVNDILKLANYFGPQILKKHVIDNSCGDGAFLKQIVQRYCDVFISVHGKDLDGLKKDLEIYIHGIEIDINECKKCINNLEQIVNDIGIYCVKWDVNPEDTLTVTKYDGLMDYVLGNPPYVRVHNLGEEFSLTKQFSFAQNGMTDLYIVFYQIGLTMLNDNGVLGYITPSSFYNSLAGKYMRRYFIDNRLLKKVVDLKHYQAFDATTYTTIVVLKKKNENNFVEYFEFDETKKTIKNICSFENNEFYIGGKFYFALREVLQHLGNILNYEKKEKNFVVKNGYATLADKVFIGNFCFKSGVIPIVKASTGDRYTCIYPYDKNGKIIEFNKLPGDVRDYLEDSWINLRNRSIDNTDNWYGFGRTQGINDTYREKYAINTLVRNKDDIKISKCEKGVGVYSGLYILTDVEQRKLEKILISDDFVSYISSLSKYKSGGYYTFSSSDLSKYLNYVYDRSEV